MDFKEISNLITTNFNTLATANNWTVRYDNDPRDTPNNVNWLKININFGDSSQYEIGVQSYRIVGIFTIQIFTKIGVGIADGLDIANIIVDNFTNLVLDNGIRFSVPDIKNVGRDGNLWQINVNCNFVIDTN